MSAVDRLLRGGRASTDGVTRVAVYGDMGLSEHAKRVVAQLTNDVDRSGVDGGIDAVLHLGDFGYNLPDPLKRNWDIREDWYIAHKQK